MKPVQFILLLLSQLYYAQGQEEIVGQEGDKVVLQCPVNVPECGQYHSLKWYRDSARVFVYSPILGFSNPEGALLDRCFDLSLAHLGSDCVRGSLEATEAKVDLTIEPLAMKDEGKYRCEITYLDVSKGCEMVHSTSLRTIAPPEHVGVSLKSNEGEDVTDKVVGPFAAGSKVEVMCKSTGGKPEVDIKWSWEGKDDVEGEVKVEENEDGTSTVISTLELTLEREMTGTYLVCSVENEAVDEPITAKVQLDVNVAVESMEIVEESLTGEEELETTVTCVAHRSRPPATITWTLGDDSVEFTVNQEEKLQDDDTYETRSDITFVPTFEQNGMAVKCQATNEVMDEPLEEEKALNILYAPRVKLLDPTNQTLIEKDLLTLECVTDSNPETINKIEWFLNGELIATENITSGEDSDDVSDEDKSGEDEAIESKDGVLHIYNIHYSRSGEYSCRAYNDIGDGRSTDSAFIEVLYPPKGMVVLSHQLRSEEEAQNLTLTCQIESGNPFEFDTVSWYLDGVLIRTCGGEEDDESEDSETVEEFPENVDDHEVGSGAEFGEIGSMDFKLWFVECSEDVRDGVLEIRFVDRTYHGDWTCAGSNIAGHGDQSEVESLNVHYVPGTPDLRHEEQWLQRGDEPTLYCQLEDPGNPEADSYIWKKDNERIEGESAMNLTLSTLGPKDQGNNYSCQAVNDVGNGKEEFLQLEIFAEPTFLTELPEQSRFLSTGPELFLECKVECELNTEDCLIDWWREGEYIGSEDERFTVEETHHPKNEDEDIFESVSSKLSWNLNQFPEQKLGHDELSFTVSCMTKARNEPFAETSISSNTTILVEYPPESVELSETFIQKEEGESYPDPIFCSGLGVPEPSASWKFNGEEISDDAFLNFSNPLQKDQRGDYFCHVSNEHGTQIANLTIDVLFKPSCSLTSSLEEEEVILTCSSEANPEDVKFFWSREGTVNFTGQESPESPMESSFRLKVHNETHGTYYCRVRNSVGEGNCSIEISEDTLAKELSDGNLKIIIGVVAVVVGILLIASICLCHYCCKRNKSGKGQNTPEKNGGTAQEKQVYENLPFNGLKTPPTKVLNPKLPDDMDYADADFKDVKAGGPDKSKDSSLQKK